MSDLLNRKISIAPMMDWTDRHERFFLRVIAPHVLLYTEMITTGALIHGDFPRFLQFDAAEHPVALQLGGSSPKDLAHCAKLGENYGYDEINLNVGCPSDRVQAAQIGACLMLQPRLVADCIAAMIDVVSIPVTIKCRIGVDEQDSFADLANFIEQTSFVGCQTYIIHARKAWLKGLSPKQNRDIPPLQYQTVYDIKKAFPHLNIVINGGISSVEEIKEHLTYVDGVMIGREGYTNPYFLTEIEKIFFAQHDPLSREDIMQKFIPYVEKQLRMKIKLSQITRHILGLYKGAANARKWRQYISQNTYKENAGLEVLHTVIDIMKSRSTDEPNFPQF